jgi:NAD(P)-dependent dehydrogenase (short-subunit alcohol dehydrogenase family)
VKLPLAGATAVVAGASRGIGLAIAERLRGAGAHVVRLARSLEDRDSEGMTDLRCDLTRQDQVARAAARVVERRGAPEVLVNSAGVFALGELPSHDPATFHGMIEGNLVGPFLLMRSLLPAMVKRGSGVVVTIGSVADHTPLPGNAGYAASKYGLRGLHEVLARELRGTGLRASLVSPGPVNTSMWDAVDPDRRPGFTKRADMLKPEDVAEAVLFVCTRPERVAIPVLHVEPRA